MRRVLEYMGTYYPPKQDPNVKKRIGAGRAGRLVGLSAGRLVGWLRLEHH